MMLSRSDVLFYQQVTSVLIGVLMYGFEAYVPDVAPNLPGLKVLKCFKIAGDTRLTKLGFG